MKQVYVGMCNRCGQLEFSVTIHMVHHGRNGTYLCYPYPAKISIKSGDVEFREAVPNRGV